MSIRFAVLVASAAVVAAPAVAAAAETTVVCTLVVEAADGRVVRRDGDCDRRVTPASTFKIAIALLGYDAGILTSETAPEWPFRPGYADWMPVWRQATSPRTWMRDSVVWYSQEITKRLGAARFAAGVRALGYGNADVSGDPGENNGLTRAWLSSSLAISPAEQVTFLRRLVARSLPVAPAAQEATARLLDLGDRPGGWRVWGKTGSGPDRAAARGAGWGYGWFVGGATREGRTIVFARLIHDTARRPEPSGPRAREELLAELFPAAR